MEIGNDECHQVRKSKYDLKSALIISMCQLRLKLNMMDEWRDFPEELALLLKPTIRSSRPLLPQHSAKGWDRGHRQRHSSLVPKHVQELHSVRYDLCIHMYV
jgi:hypothetical protein